MLEMMKSDFLQYRKISILPIFILIPVMYWAISMPIFTIIFLIIPALLSDIYYYEKKVNINRFFISLPVSAKAIIRSRYLFFLLVLTLIVIYQWSIEYGIDSTATGSYFVYSWKDALTLFCLGMIVTALILPLFYLFRSFIPALITMLFIIFVLFYVLLDPLVKILGMEDYILFNDLDQGLALLVETYFPFWPFVFLLLFAILFYYLSAKLSTAIFQMRDR